MMDDVFFNDVDLNCHGEWQTKDGEVSVLSGIAEGEADILAVKIDIASPLTTLKAILQHKLGIDFSHCEIWLQDILQLAEETTLSEQCIQGEGAVQVNLELKSVQNVDRINILDVLKPQEEDISNDKTMLVNDANPIIDYVQQEISHSDGNFSCALPVLEEVELSLPDSLTASSQNVTKISPSKVIISNLLSSSVKNVLPAVPVKELNTNVKKVSKPSVSTNENITRWVMDSGFRRDQDRLKIPFDPAMWTQDHVQHWIEWAINQFNLKNVIAATWSWIDGPALCNMSHTEFTAKVPDDPNDLFWTHLELLRKCKFVGVIQKPVPYLQYVTTPLTVKGDSSKFNRHLNIKASPSKVIQADTVLAATASGNRAGSNGQVQLWQFLLELLTDKNFRDAISWIGTTGEFKLNNPEMVAQLWGERKNKPNMNYEKLSRALRYYYDGQLINKVSGKRFVYKFVCDLKELLGYTAEELNRLVTECDQRAKLKRHPSLYM